MKTKQPHSTKLLFAGIFIAAAVVATLLLPRLGSWREARVQSLIRKSQQAQGRNLQETYLRQAMLIGLGTTSAPKAQSNYFLSIGRYDKAWPVLQNWPLHRDYNQLGDYALRAQNYQAAQRFYATSIRLKASSAGYTGLAAALFNLGDNKDGCANAAKANKLDLSDTAAHDIALACLILSPGNKALQITSFPELATTKLASNRGKGIYLIQSRVYAPGEKLLLAAPQRLPSDSLALAHLASSRQDDKLAIERAKAGLNISPTNPGLIEILALSSENLGNAKQATHYQDLLKALQFNGN